VTAAHLPQNTRCAAHRPHSPHRRVFPLHGEHGLDGDRDVAPGHRARYRRESARAQACADLLSRRSRGVHPDQRLGRRPPRLAHRVRERHRRVRRRIAAVRRVEHARRVRRRALPAGHRRGDDGAGRASRPAARRAEERARRGAQLPHHPGAAGARDRAGARRSDHAVLSLALDLPDQSADRRAGALPRAASHPEREGARNAGARPRRLRALGSRAVGADAGTVFPRRPPPARKDHRGLHHPGRARAGCLSCDRPLALQAADLSPASSQGACSASASARRRFCCRSCCRSASE